MLFLLGILYKKNKKLFFRFNLQFLHKAKRVVLNLGEQNGMSKTADVSTVHYSFVFL